MTTTTFKRLPQYHAQMVYSTDEKFKISFHAGITKNINKKSVHKYSLKLICFWIFIKLE